jgi:TM2 domain-containing membrane protein YozV
MKQQNHSKENLSNVKVNANAVLKKHILVLYTGIFIMIALYFFLRFMNARNIVAIQYLVFIQIVIFIIQSIPSIRDLLNKSEDRLSFNGKIIAKKGFFIKTLTVQDSTGKRMKLLTDIHSFQLDDKITGICTKNARIIGSYKKS